MLFFKDSSQKREGALKGFQTVGNKSNVLDEDISLMYFLAQQLLLKILNLIVVDVCFYLKVPENLEVIFFTFSDIPRRNTEKFLVSLSCIK